MNSTEKRRAEALVQEWHRRNPVPTVDPAKVDVPAKLTAAIDKAVVQINAAVALAEKHNFFLVFNHKYYNGESGYKADFSPTPIHPKYQARVEQQRTAVIGRQKLLVELTNKIWDDQLDFPTLFSLLPENTERDKK